MKIPCTWLAVCIGAALLAGPALAQSKSTKPFTPPKTPWGDPDLQGLWPASAQIPMQRPAAVSTEIQLSDEELAKRKAEFDKAQATDSEEFAKNTGSGPNSINPPAYWIERAHP